MPSDKDNELIFKEANKSADDFLGSLGEIQSKANGVANSVEMTTSKIEAISKSMDKFNGSVSPVAGNVKTLNKQLGKNVELAKSVAGSTKNVEKTSKEMVSALKHISSNSSGLMELLKSLKDSKDNKINIDSKEIEKALKLLEQLNAPLDISEDIKVNDEEVLEVLKTVKKLKSESTALFNSFKGKKMDFTIDTVLKMDDEAKKILNEPKKSEKKQKLKVEADVPKNLTDAIEKQASLMGSLAEKFEEGSREGAEFAGGLGESATGMTALGVASAFVAVKIGELSQEFVGARAELAQFNIDLTNTGLSQFGREGLNNINEMRDSLNLTVGETGDFIDILKDAQTFGVASIVELREEAELLRDAFGEKSNEALKQYVDLLKEIPTLQSDLAVGADVDQNLGALFALADSGNLNTVFDLQGAGLLGGAGNEKTAEEQRESEVLKATQETNKLVEDLRNDLLGVLGPWTPYIAGIAGGTAMIGGIAFGVAQLKGGLTTILKNNNKESAENNSNRDSNSTRIRKDLDDIEFAIRNKKNSPRIPTSNPLGRRGGNVDVDVDVDGSKDKKVKRRPKPKKKVSFRDSLSRGKGSFITAFGRAQAQNGNKNFLKNTSRAVSSGVKGFSQGGKLQKVATGIVKNGAKIGTGLGLAAVAIELGADYLGDKMIEEGKVIEGKLTKVGGGLVGGVATIASGLAIGATIGSAVPVLGTAIGGAIGAFAGAGVALYTSAEELGQNMQDVGHALDSTEYSFITRAFAKTLSVQGKALSTTFDVVDGSITYFSNAIGSATSSVFDWITLSRKELDAREKLQNDIQKRLDSITEEQIASAHKYADDFARTAELSAEVAKKVQESAKEFQSLFNLVRNVSKNEKGKLGQELLESGTSQNDLSINSGIGNAQDSLETAISGTSQSLQALNSSVELARERIIANEKISVKQREVLLAQLRSATSQGLSKFLDSMQDLVARAGKTSNQTLANREGELVASRLKNQESGIGQLGKLNIDEFQERINKSAEELNADGIQAKFDAFSKSIEEIEETAKKESETLAKSIKNDNSRKTLEKEIADVTKDISRGAESVVDIDTGEVTNLRSKLEELKANLNGSVANLVKITKDGQIDFSSVDVDAVQKEIDRRQNIANELSSKESENSKVFNSFEGSEDQKNAIAISNAFKSVADSQEVEQGIFEGNFKPITDSIKGLEGIIGQDGVKKLLEETKAIQERQGTNDAKTADKTRNELMGLIARGLGQDLKGNQKLVMELEKASKSQLEISKQGSQNQKQLELLKKTLELRNADSTNAFNLLNNQLNQEFENSLSAFIESLENQFAQLQLKSAKTIALETQAGIAGTDAEGAFADGGAGVSALNKALQLNQQAFLSNFEKLTKVQELTKKNIEDALSDNEALKAQFDTDETAIKNFLDTQLKNASDADRRNAEDSVKRKNPNLAGESFNRAVKEELKARIKGTKEYVELNKTLQISKSAFDTNQAKVKANAEAYQKTTDKINEFRNQALDRIFSLGEQTQEALEKGLDFRKANEVVDAKFAQIDFQIGTDSFGTDVQGSAERIAESLSGIPDLIKVGRDNLIKKFNESLESEIGLINSDIDARLQTGKEDSSALEKERLDRIAGAQANVQKNVALANQNAEDKAKEGLSRFDNAQEIRGERADFFQEMADELASQGANFDVVFDLQKKSVQFEMQKLDLAREQVEQAEALNAQGLLSAQELERIRMNATRQEIQVRSKALGAQKDTFEKILGSAFGELSDVGARRNFASEISLLGIENTRVQNQDGIFVKGEAKTIEERRNENLFGDGFGTRTSTNIKSLDTIAMDAGAKADAIVASNDSAQEKMIKLLAEQNKILSEDIAKNLDNEDPNARRQKAKEELESKLIDPTKMSSEESSQSSRDAKLIADQKRKSQKEKAESGILDKEGKALSSVIKNGFEIDDISDVGKEEYSQHFKAVEDEISKDRKNALKNFNNGKNTKVEDNFNDKQIGIILETQRRLQGLNKDESVSSRSKKDSKRVDPFGGVANGDTIGRPNKSSHFGDIASGDTIGRFRENDGNSLKRKPIPQRAKREVEKKPFVIDPNDPKLKAVQEQSAKREAKKEANKGKTAKEKLADGEKQDSKDAINNRLGIKGEGEKVSNVDVMNVKMLNVQSTNGEGFHGGINTDKSSKFDEVKDSITEKNSPLKKTVDTNSGNSASLGNSENNAGGFENSSPSIRPSNITPQENNDGAVNDRLSSSQGGGTANVNLNVSVQGEARVSFDTAMFENMVIKLIGENSKRIQVAFNKSGVVTDG